MQPRLVPLAALAAIAALLSGCDLLGIETASQIDARKEAEGRAIGSACRHAVRSIEDCYAQNPKAGKAAVFSGWREMDEYMRQNDVAGMPFSDKKLPMITEKAEKAEKADEVAAAPAKPGAKPAAGGSTTVGGASPTRATSPLPGTTPPRVAPGAATSPATPQAPQAPASPQRPATPQRPG